MKMPEEFLQKISRLGDKTDEIIPRVLEAGGNVVLSKVKSNLSSVIGSGSTADHLGSARRGFTISDRRYIAHEDDTGYHHYAIDVAKSYETEE